jgi:hypothetical protein
LAGQRTQKSLLTHFTPFLSIAWTLTRIACKVSPADYGPLSDEDLSAIAADTFALLDEEERRASNRGKKPVVSGRPVWHHNFA